MDFDKFYREFRPLPIGKKLKKLKRLVYEVEKNLRVWDSDKLLEAQELLKKTSKDVQQATNSYAYLFRDLLN